ncbi:MAG: hypothetical protein KF708_21885 [Pirellulales bacterium]|nr:hypothetical protein [Pirellulales bacterium]
MSTAETDTAPVAARPAPHHAGSSRETIESILLAFIMAFLFRSFEAEAFVIPTGSMAPTLMGRHKDLVCENCGYSWQSNASDEIDARSGARLAGRFDPHTGEPVPDVEVLACTCPNCRFTIDLTPELPGQPIVPSYSGDRIIASKLPLALDPPQRWDVTVFRFPEEAQTNYIKRLVGLPNETIRIYHGDLYVRGAEDADFVMLRKPHETTTAMLQPVYDNDYLSEDMFARGWLPRWQADPSSDSPTQSSAGSGWTSPDNTRSFEIDAATSGEHWIRYRHIVPSFEDWLAMEGSAPRESMRPPQPQLISDFTGYNMSYCPDPIATRYNDENGPAPDTSSLGLHWVSDLALECQLTSRGETGRAILELVEGGARLQARFDLATGQMTLAIDRLPDFSATAQTPIRGAGTWNIRFANIDDRLLLWIDDQPISFDAPTEFTLPDAAMPTPADLAPLGVGAEGASLRVGGLRVLRDVYYIATNKNDAGRWSALSDYSPADSIAGLSRSALVDFMSQPDRWPAMRRRRGMEFTLGPEQFFLLGDNSPRSQDGRLWVDDCFVDRSLIVGRALFVYWPHAWEAPYSFSVRAFGREMTLPFYPNFRRMGAIR